MAQQWKGDTDVGPDKANGAEMDPGQRGLADEIDSSLVLGSDVSQMYRSSLLDEHALVAACQEEFAAKAPQQLRPKIRAGEKQLIADRIMSIGVGGKDASFIKRLRERLDEYSVKLPSVTIEYRDLTVKTDALVGSAGIPTVVSTILAKVKQVLGMKQQTVEVSVVDGVSGVLKPGRMTLVLGPPSCGKSTFMKVLAGQTDGLSGMRISGQVLYNGHSAEEFNVQRTCALVAQQDCHIPILTVEETMQFSARCQNGTYMPSFGLPEVIDQAREQAGPGPAGPGASEDHDEVEDLIRRIWGTDVKAELTLRLLGLGHARGTVVGGPMLRGLSGGERKRLSSAEMMCGPRRVLIMDEISTGLDSATLFSTVQMLGNATRGLDFTTAITLLQPPPEVFELFDDLLLMSEDGGVLYHGPVGEAVPFFDSLGFSCPARKDVPSYLLEVTTPLGQLQYAGPQLAQAAEAQKKALACGSAPELLVGLPQVKQAYWEQSPCGRAMAQQLATPFSKSDSHPAALEKRDTALSAFDAIKVAFQRQVLLLRRDVTVLRSNLIMVSVMAVLQGSLFFGLKPDVEKVSTFFGAAFIMVLFMAMRSMPQMAMVISQKPVWVKHRDAKFLPPYAQGLAMAISQVPLSLLDVIIYCCIAYFMIGFTRTPAAFFTFLAILVSVSLSTSCIFRLLGVLAKNETAATAYGALIIISLVITSGFVIVRSSIPVWMIWIYYISPFSWAIRAVAITEMSAERWQYMMPGESLPAGQQALQAFDFFSGQEWVWAGLAYNLGLFLLLTLATIWGLGRCKMEAPRAQVPDQEELDKASREAQEHRQALEQQQQAGSTTINQPDTSIESAKHVAVSVSGGLPFTPVTLVFKDLRYYVPNPAAAQAGKAGKAGKEGSDPPAQLELLKGITGYAEPGTLTALMGGSGAGKTTLMDVIAGRKTVGEIKGAIHANGRAVEQRSWARCMGYVEQTDIHSPGQTVAEALWSSARLRLPASVTDLQVAAYVAEVIAMVDMGAIQHALVGSPGGAGLSVEQRKRLTIAVELVANPPVIFMDEPTSGLDARAAAIVMRAVRAVGDSGRTVVVTIHQPSIDIFEAFDRLLLMQRGGRTTYFGDLGVASCRLVEYLQAVPGVAALRAGHNPATWMLEVTGGSMAMTSTVVQVDWPALYAGCDLARANERRCDELLQQGSSQQAALQVADEYAQSFSTQMRELLSKYTHVYWRSPSYNSVRLFICTFMGLVYGCVYFGSASLGGSLRLAHVQNVMGIMYSSTNYLGMINLMAVLPMAVGERVVFYRERAASMYHPVAYGLAISSVELPYLMAQSCIFAGIAYFMVGFTRAAEPFFYFLLMFMAALTFFNTFGQFVVYITPNSQVAQILAGAFNMVFSIFSGFIMPYPTMPVYWQWLNRTSPTTWMLYGLGASQLGNVETPLTYAGKTMPTYQFLEGYFGYSYSFRWPCLAIVVAYIAAFRLASILALRYANFLRR